MNKFGQNTDQPAVYFNKLYMKNVRCFKGNHEIDLGNGKGEPSQWTVILGNNNVGKTTILRVIALLELVTEVSSNEITVGYRGNSLLSKKKYISFDHKTLFIGNELVLREKNNSFYSTLLSEQFYNNIKANQHNEPFKLLKHNDFEWITHIKLTSNITKSGDSTHFSYPKNTEKLDFFKLIGYGTSRMMVDSQSVQGDNTQGLFDNKTLLLNVEEWLKELHFAANNKNEQAEKRYKQVENILCGGLLPDVTKIQITTIPDKSSFETFPEFLTSQGWVRLEDLGYGYQATLAWVADLAKRMFDQYPDLETEL